MEGGGVVVVDEVALAGGLEIEFHAGEGGVEADVLAGGGVTDGFAEGDEAGAVGGGGVVFVGGGVDEDEGACFDGADVDTRAAGVVAVGDAGEFALVGGGGVGDGEVSGVDEGLPARGRWVMVKFPP